MWTLVKWFTTQLCELQMVQPILYNKSRPRNVLWLIQVLTVSVRTVTYSSVWFAVNQYSVLFMQPYGNAFAVVIMHVHARSFSSVLLFATPWTVACQTPVCMRFPKPRILVWVAISYPRRSSWPRDGTRVSYIGR